MTFAFWVSSPESLHLTIHIAGNSTTVKSQQQEIYFLFSSMKRGSEAEINLPTPCAMTPSLQEIQTRWCPVAHKLGDPTQICRGVRKRGYSLCCQISHHCLLWDMNPTPNSPDRRQSLQSSPCPAPGSATAGGRGEGLAMVLPPSHTLTPSHPQNWQKETCVSFPAVSWTSLTACLQILMITLPELSSRQWLLPWELSERSELSFHRQTGASAPLTCGFTTLSTTYLKAAPISREGCTTPLRVNTPKANFLLGVFVWLSSIYR